MRAILNQLLKTRKAQPERFLDSIISSEDSLRSVLKNFSGNAEVQDQISANVDNLRLGLLAVPNEAYEAARVPVKYNPKLPESTFGQFVQNAVIPSRTRVELNPLHAGNSSQYALGTPVHEFAHALSLRPHKLRGSIYEPAIKDSAKLSAINRTIKSLDVSDKTLRQHGLLDEDDVYDINPAEVFARTLAFPIQYKGDLQPTQKSIEDFHSFFNAKFTPAATDAVDAFKYLYRPLYDLAKPNFSKYLPAAAGIAALSQAEDSLASGVIQRTEQPSKTSKINISANVPTERGGGVFSEGMEKVGRVFWDSLMKKDVKLVDPLSPDETIGVGLAAMGGGMLSAIGAAKKIAEGAGTVEDVMDVVSTATGVRPGIAAAKGARSAWEALSGKKVKDMVLEDPLSR